MAAASRLLQQQAAAAAATTAAATTAAGGQTPQSPNGGGTPLEGAPGAPPQRTKAVEEAAALCKRASGAPQLGGAKGGPLRARGFSDSGVSSPQVCFFLPLLCCLPESYFLSLQETCCLSLRCVAASLSCGLSLCLFVSPSSISKETGTGNRTRDLLLLSL